MPTRALGFASSPRAALGLRTRPAPPSACALAPSHTWPHPADAPQDGFVNSGEPLLTAAEVAELSDTLDGIIDRGPEGFAEGDHAPVSFRSFSGSDDPTSKPNWQIVNTWEAAEPFHRLIFHPKVVGAIAQLTRAADIMIWHDQVQYKPAEYGGATVRCSSHPNPPVALDRRCRRHDSPPRLREIAGAHY